MRLDISGGRQLHAIARAAKQQSAGLRNEFSKGMRGFGGVIELAVRANVRSFMPSGYEETFAGALEIKTEVRLAYERLSVVAYAPGRTGSRRRDAERLNAGVLKHKTFGHSPWVEQPIPPGWFDKPAMAAVPEGLRHIEAVANRIAKMIEEAA